MRTEEIGYYLFDADGTRLDAPAPEEPMPIEPEQIEGILAAAGSFGQRRQSTTSQPGITRARYDGYRLIGLRGDRGVLAAVYPDSAEAPRLEDLRRRLRRLEERIPSRAARWEPPTSGMTPGTRRLSRL